VEDDKAIHYNLESQSIGQYVISMSGWAFIDTTQNNERDSIFVSLSSVSKSYLAPAVTSQRMDLNGAFNKQNIANSGFRFLAFTDSVQKGSYKVGLVIKDARGNLVKQTLGIETTINIPLYASPVKITQLPAEGRISYDMVLDDGDKEFSARGWAARENQGAEGCQISLILKSDQDIYLASTNATLRPDVTSSLNNKYKLDSSGYSVKLLKSTFPKGKYRLGLLIEDYPNKINTYAYTDKEIIIQ
jgi:hypothetical protein